MQYWLMKSEPDVWSIDQQKKAGSKGAAWDGVRNYQAAKKFKIYEKRRSMFFLSFKYWKRDCWYRRSY